jgi:hypothetical protein
MDAVQEYAAQVAAGTTTDSSLQSSADIIQEYANSIKPVEEPVIDNVEPTIADVEPTNVTNEPSIEVTIDEPTNVEEPVNTFDESSFVSEKTGGKYSSFEEWENSLKTPQFENETSKGVYELLTQGKIAEVYDILHKKQMAETINSKPDDAVLKAYIKATNPEFDESEVEDEYNEKYTIDEFAFDDSKLSREQKKLNQRIKADVDSAKQFFNKMAEDIKLPVLQQNQQQEPVNDTEAQEERIKYLTSLQSAESKAKQIPFSWKDDKAGISINGKFDIQPSDLSKYRGAAENIEEHFANRYYKEGKYNGELLLTDLYVADNLPKIVSAAVSQAVTQTRLAMLKQNKNITFTNEPSGTFKPSDADTELAMYEQLFLGHRKR